MSTGIPQSSFTAGELAPALYGRVDFARYYTSLKTLRNFIIRPYGGVINRGGTHFAAETNSSATKSRLIPFIYSSSQSYALEFGDLTIRIIKDGGIVVYSSGPNIGDPVVIVSPFTEADLPYLKFTQSNDVMTITHTTIPTQELIRYDHDSWEIREFVATGGPFNDINTDKNIVVSSSGTSGLVVLRATSPIFRAEMAGMLFYLEANGEAQAASVGKWEVQKAVTLGQVVRAGTHFYKAQTAGTTGTVRPTVIGLGETEYDGSPGVLWKYLHSGSGTAMLVDDLVSMVYWYATGATPAIGATITSGAVSATILSFEYIKITGQVDGTYGKVVVRMIAGTFVVGATVTSGGWSSTIKEYGAVDSSMVMSADVQDYIPDSLVMSGANPTKTITNAWMATGIRTSSPIYFVIAAHGYKSGDVVNISGVTGLTALNGTWSVTWIDVNTLMVRAIGLIPIQYWTGGGSVDNYSLGAPSYKWAAGAWGYRYPATDLLPSYPGTVGYCQERLVFAGSDDDPNTFWMSRSQGFRDFGKSAPLLDDDSITYRINSNQRVEVRHIVELSELILMTTAGPFMIRGGQDGVIKPGAVSRKKQPAAGCSHIAPINVGSHALWVQEQGSQVRSLGYSFADDAFTGQDLTALSHHLFLGRTVVSWCYQSAPFAAVWVVLDNGLLLSLAYLPEQEVTGWSWHDTDGLVESCCSIMEGGKDRVYLIVLRDGVRYIERMAERLYTDPKEAFFMDCGLTYRGAPADVISGLDHLEGKEVAILADGNVHARRTVVGGEVTLDYNASIVHVGLPYVSDFETLEIANSQQNIRDKNKIINHISLIVDHSRGIWVGPDADHLIEAKRSQFLSYEDTTLETTGLLDLRIQATWNKNGRVFVRQSDPLPLSILNVIPEVTNGGS